MALQYLMRGPQYTELKRGDNEYFLGIFFVVKTWEPNFLKKTQNINDPNFFGSVFIWQEPKGCVLQCAQSFVSVLLKSFGQS